MTACVHHWLVATAPAHEGDGTLPGRCKRCGKRRTDFLRYAHDDGPAGRGRWKGAPRVPWTNDLNLGGKHPDDGKRVE